MAAAWLLTPGARQVRDPKPSEFKFLSQIQSFPDTRVVATSTDIRGRVDRVESPHLRFAPGLSLRHTEPPPHATAVLTDGDRPVFLYDRHSVGAASFARNTLSYAGYELHGSPGSVLILLAGGGLAVPCALTSGAERIRILHANPHVADQIRTHYGLPVTAGNPRSHLAQSAERFDIVHVESWGATMPGADALDQDHLLTIEAFSEYLRRLAPGGVLIVSRRLLLPPADSLRLWAAAREALGREGSAHPERCIVILRGWDTYTLLVFREPPADLIPLQEIARRGNFDVMYAHGVDETLSNRYNVFDAPYHFREHLRLESALNASAAEDYFRDYVLDVAPQSDRQPFPGHFLKWRRLPDLYRMLGSRLHAFGLSGEVMVAVALTEAALISALLLLPPLRVISRKKEKISLPGNAVLSRHRRRLHARRAAFRVPRHLFSGGPGGQPHTHPGRDPCLVRARGTLDRPAHSGPPACIPGGCSAGARPCGGKPHAVFIRAARAACARARQPAAPCGHASRLRDGDALSPGHAPPGAEPPGEVLRLGRQRVRLGAGFDPQRANRHQRGFCMGPRRRRIVLRRRFSGSSKDALDERQRYEYGLVMNIRVECFSGYRGDETPQAVWIGERRIAVAEVLDRWLAPDHRYFKFRGDDQGIYIIRNDMVSFAWQITFYQDPKMESGSGRGPAGGTA